MFVSYNIRILEAELFNIFFNFFSRFLERVINIFHVIPVGTGKLSSQRISFVFWTRYPGNTNEVLYKLCIISTLNCQRNRTDDKMFLTRLFANEKWILNTVSKQLGKISN